MAGFNVLPLNFYNRHEADLNCVTAPQKIIDFDKHKKSSGYEDFYVAE